MADGAGHVKQIGLRIKGAGTPSEQQLAAIRQYTLADMPAEQLYVRTFVIAHNAIDRDNECFGEAILNDFARTLPGKGLHIIHPLSWDGNTGPGEGRFFEAQLQRMSLDDARKELREPGLVFPPDARDAVLLMASMYIARTPDNESLLIKIDAGIASDVSIGFTAKGGPERLRDNEGRELNSYRWNGPGEALESSLVWLGAQPGARAVKAAKPQPENTMDFEKLFKDAETANAAMKAQLDAAQKTVTLVESVRKALGDDGALLDAPEALVESVTAGKAHKSALVDDIVKCERLLGVCGDKDEDVAAAKAAHAALPLAKLDALHKHYAVRVPTGAQIKGGDPNTQNNGASKLPAALDSPAI